MNAPRLKEHELKSWPEYFSALLTGKQTFEIRSIYLDTLNRRDFQVGDILILREFVPCPTCGGLGVVRDYTELVDCECHWSANPKGTYTGRSLKRLITHITSFRQQSEMVVMALKEWREPRSVRECPPYERISAIADHVHSLGAYTQAAEIEALGSELQRIREEREQLWQEVLRLRPAGSVSDSILKS